jgi:hypothetical protein
MQITSRHIKFLNLMTLPVRDNTDNEFQQFYRHVFPTGNF